MRSPAWIATAIRGMDDFVSRDDRILVLQLAALKKAGCKQVFKCDALSGATTKRRALLRCLKKLEPWRQPPPRNNLSALVRFLFRCSSTPKYRRSGMALPIDPDADGSTLERMAPPKLFRHLFHRAPVHARMFVYVFDEPLEHQKYCGRPETSG
jgi:hypothetical protein